jgi:hypothetical protein
VLSVTVTDLSVLRSQRMLLSLRSNKLFTSLTYSGSLGDTQRIGGKNSHEIFALELYKYTNKSSDATALVSFIATKAATKFASELYRLSDHRLSAKLMPTFADIGVLRGQRGGFLWP